ncbi:hypothetical protein MIND_01060900 [Mycena indigotica]|uniref:Uncharacterized protein n=1 Tax=Mycena indigotica TaxID=2126181 RepID=A0A8H6S907_9AGAR|nr:uncharacterized protein MIND_01060900 [Mycena indigotica]KAF7295220.1 hypothetical protein MIND_01060900 [Mycena indigotica]
MSASLSTSQTSLSQAQSTSTSAASSTTPFSSTSQPLVSSTRPSNSTPSVVSSTQTSTPPSSSPQPASSQNQLPTSTQTSASTERAVPSQSSSVVIARLGTSDDSSSSVSVSPSISIDNNDSASSSSVQPSSSSPPSSSAPPPSSSTPPPSSSSTVVSVSSQQLSSNSDVSSSIPDISSQLPSSLAALQLSTELSILSSGATSFTTIVTSIDGQLTTITSALPTSLSTSRSSITSAQRTKIIAGATAAGVGVILLLLGALFVYKRHKSRKREFSEAIGRVRREAHGAGGVGLLDEEGLDDDDTVPMSRYQDNVVAQASTSTLGPPQSPAPSIFRQRAETGSLFREEGVYPPPGAQFVDPLVGIGSGLGSIVDDVMGPAEAHKSSSMSSASSSLYADPFRDLSHSTSASDPSLYYDRPGAASSLSMASSQTSSNRPITPQSLLGLPAGAAPTPKKSSPLVNISAPPPSAATTWLNRSPKKHVRGLSGSQSSHEGSLF